MASVPTSFGPRWLHASPERVNTHAAPTSPLSNRPPTTAVFPSPESETETLLFAVATVALVIGEHDSAKRQFRAYIGAVGRIDKFGVSTLVEGSIIVKILSTHQPIILSIPVQQ